MGTISNLSLLGIFSVLAITLVMNPSIIYAGGIIDDIPPELTITVTPDDPSFDPTPSFSFIVFDISPVTTLCRIDVAAFSACTSPYESPALTVGIHTFEVKATDFYGNSITKSYSWTFLTLSQSADQLISEIESQGFPINVEKSLIGPLKKVSKILNDGNPDNDQAACDKLTGFLENLAAKADKIDDVDLVNYLHDYGQAIKDEIGCPLV